MFILLICAVTFFISTCSAYNSLSTIASAEGKNNVTVVIDSGHGGEDGGAVASDGTVEKDLNLSIAMKLKKLLVQNGINVITTRESDKAIYDEGCNSLKEKKISDMNRLSIFNDSPNNVIISIHQNKFEQSKYSGTQIFYSTNNGDSSVLAECIRKSVTVKLQTDNTRECKPAGKNIYLLYNALNPAVIVECGFISNENELSLLKDDTYQSKMALLIYSGFMQYCSNNKQQDVR